MDPPPRADGSVDIELVRRLDGIREIMAARSDTHLFAKMKANPSHPPVQLTQERSLHRLPAGKVTARDHVTCPVCGVSQYVRWYAVMHLIWLILGNLAVMHSIWIVLEGVKADKYIKK